MSSQNVAAEAGDVPAGLIEPRDDAAGDGVAQPHKNDRDRPRLPLDGSGRHVRAGQLSSIEIDVG
jgi:hypothetical protein